MLITEGGADVNIPMTKTGRTPLFLAALNGHTRVVLELLDHPTIEVDHLEIVVESYEKQRINMQSYTQEADLGQMFQDRVTLLQTLPRSCAEHATHTTAKLVCQM